MRTKESIGYLKDETVEIVSEEEKMVEILNKYFSSVYTEQTLAEMPKPRILCNDNHKLEEVDLSIQGVLKKIQELNPKSQLEMTVPIQQY